MSKRITLMYSAIVLDANDLTTHLPLKADGVKLCKSTEPYFTDYLSDNGVIGGGVSVKILNDLPFLKVVYRVASLAPKCLKEIKSYTTAAFDDGVGENGFPIMIGGVELLLFADTDDDIEVMVEEDKKAVAGVPFLQIAARKGDISEAILQLTNKKGPDIDALYQGHTALHLAILNGHLSLVKLLLSHGADPNILSHCGTTPLECCVLARTMDDNASLLVTQALLAAGAKRGKKRAKSFALERHKSKTFEVLK